VRCVQLVSIRTRKESSRSFVGFPKNSRMPLLELSALEVNCETSAEAPNSHVRATDLVEHAHAERPGRTVERQGCAEQSRDSGSGQDAPERNEGKRVTRCPGSTSRLSGKRLSPSPLTSGIFLDEKFPQGLNCLKWRLYQNAKP